MNNRGERSKFIQNDIDGMMDDVASGEGGYIGELKVDLPLLVNNPQSGTFWSKKQKRLYKNLLSWMTYLKREGYQLFRMDLTSIPGYDQKLLTKDFKRLRRAIENKFGYSLHYFKIETSEGNGVLHLVVAIKSKNAAYIPHDWLSSEWKKITGASIVYIKRITEGKGSRKKIGKYFVQQYLAGQSAIVRVSWSWWRSAVPLSKAFTEFYKEAKKSSYGAMCAGISPLVNGGFLNYSDIIRGWSELLEKGYWIFKGAIFILGAQGVDVCYG